MKEKKVNKTMLYVAIETDFIPIPELEFFYRLKSTGINTMVSIPPSGPVRQTGLSYKPARVHRLAKSIPWDRFAPACQLHRLAGRYDNLVLTRFLAPIDFYKILALGSLNVCKSGLKLT